MQKIVGAPTTGAEFKKSPSCSCCLVLSKTCLLVFKIVHLSGCVTMIMIDASKIAASMMFIL